jgi:diguanylate cyclase (GGDEF)-like protein
MPQYRQICSQTCAKKIVYGLALFLAIVPAIVCFLHEWNRERFDAERYGTLLVEQMQQSVADSLPAWQTAVPKVLELNQNRSLFPSVAGIAFYDASSRLMYQETISRPFLPLTLATDIGLRTDGGVLGTLRIDSRVDYIVLWTLLIGLFSGGGGAMGFYFYRYSLRNIHQMQLAKQRAFEQFLTINSRLENFSQHDGLTGAYTITSVRKRATEWLEKRGEQISLLLIDIDHFRKYNNLNGHEAGDWVLKEMVSVLRGCLGDQAVIGRFGGEEFVVLLPLTTKQQAQDLAELLRKTVENHEFSSEIQCENKITISVGVSSSEKGETLQELFRQADIALYSAKDSGRNYVCFFNEPQDISPVNLRASNPGMKIEVIRKFLDRFFRETTNILPQLYEPTVLAFLHALEIWDPLTIQHSLRVNRIAMELAKAVNLSQPEMVTLNLGTLMHDIGKLSLGDSILLKKEPLTSAEYELIKHHPQVGYDLIKDDPILQRAAEIVLLHHERFDGTGYPLGLAGKEIPLLARICTIADALDAMLVDRPYCKGKSIEAARSELVKCKGQQFDPDLVDAVLTLDWDSRALVS